MNEYIEENVAYQDMVSALYMTTEALAIILTEKRPELTDIGINELQNYNDQLVARLKTRRDMKRYQVIYLNLFCSNNTLPLWNIS